MTRLPAGARKLLLALAALAACAWATPTFVQANQGAATSLAFTSANSAGDLLVLGVENNAFTVGPLSASDTQGNTWHSACGPAVSSENQAVQLFYVVNSRAGSNTVSVTGTGGNYTNMVVAEYSGVATSSPLESPCGSGTGSSATASTGAFSVTTGDLTIAMGVMGAGGTTAGSGFTSRGTDTFSMLEDQVAASGTANATVGGTSHPWAIVAAGFRPPGSASHPPCALALIGAGGCERP